MPKKVISTFVSPSYGNYQFTLDKHSANIGKFKINTKIFLPEPLPSQDQRFFGRYNPNILSDAEISPNPKNFFLNKNVTPAVLAFFVTSRTQKPTKITIDGLQTTVFPVFSQQFQQQNIKFYSKFLKISKTGDDEYISFQAPSLEVVFEPRDDNAKNNHFTQSANATKLQQRVASTLKKFPNIGDIQILDNTYIKITGKNNQMIDETDAIEVVKYLDNPYRVYGQLTYNNKYFLGVGKLDLTMFENAPDEIIDVKYDNKSEDKNIEFQIKSNQNNIPYNIPSVIQSNNNQNIIHNTSNTQNSFYVPNTIRGNTNVISQGSIISRLNELKRINNELTEDIRNDKLKISQLTNALNEKNKSIEGYENKLNNLTKLNSSQEQSIVGYEKRINDLTKLNSSIVDDRDKSILKINELTNALNEKNKSIEGYENKLNNLTKLNSSQEKSILEGKLKISQLTNALEEKNKSIEGYEDRINNLTKLNSSIVDDRDKSILKINELTNALNEKNKSIVGYEKRINDLTKLNSSQEQSIVGYEKRINDLTKLNSSQKQSLQAGKLKINELTNIVNEKDKSIQDYEKRINDLSALNSSQEQSIVGYEKRINDLTKLNSSIVGERDTSQRELNNTQFKINELSLANKELKKSVLTKTQNENFLQIRLDAFQSLLKERNLEITRLNKQKSSLNNSLRTNESNYKKNIELLNITLKNKQSRIDEQTAYLKRQNQDFIKLNKKMESQNQSIIEYKNQISSFQLQQQNLLKENQSLINTKQEQSKTIKLLQDNITQYQNDTLLLSSRVEELSNQNNILLTDLDKLSIKPSIVMGDKDNLDNNLEEESLRLNLMGMLRLMDDDKKKNDNKMSPKNVVAYYELFNAYPPLQSRPTKARETSSRETAPIFLEDTKTYSNTMYNSLFYNLFTEAKGTRQKLAPTESTIKLYRKSKTKAPFELFTNS